MAAAAGEEEEEETDIWILGGRASGEGNEARDEINPTRGRGKQR